MSTNRSVYIKLSLIFSSILSVAVLQAGPPADKGKDARGGKAENDSFSVDLGVSAVITAGISAEEAHVLASRHGITGSKPLPPGIKKNLARGKPMPPGIQKTRMPESFVYDLPKHDGYEWRQAGVDLVLVISGSLVISDVLEGVFD